MLASSDEQARLIEALLTLASSESGPSEHQPVDLSATVPAVLASREPETGRPGIRIDTVTEPATLDGDPLLVERLVANLVANAVRHNVADGRAEIRTGMSNGRAVLSVTNTGPLIPPAEVERLFQPFQRLDPRRASYPDGHGHGLGLSIVRAIAIAHHADITARPGPDGGLSVSVTFPPPVSPASKDRLVRLSTVLRLRGGVAYFGELGSSEDRDGQSDQDRAKNPRDGEWVT